jgi:hypothetical protein
MKAMNEWLSPELIPLRASIEEAKNNPQAAGADLVGYDYAAAPRSP